MHDADLAVSSIDASVDVDLVSGLLLLDRDQERVAFIDALAQASQAKDQAGIKKSLSVLKNPERTRFKKATIFLITHALSCEREEGRCPVPHCMQLRERWLHHRITLISTASRLVDKSFSPVSKEDTDWKTLFDRSTKQSADACSGQTGSVRHMTEALMLAAMVNRCPQQLKKQLEKQSQPAKLLADAHRATQDHLSDRLYGLQTPLCTFARCRINGCDSSRLSDECEDAFVAKHAERCYLPRGCEYEKYGCAAFKQWFAQHNPHKRRRKDDTTECTKKFKIKGIMRSCSEIARLIGLHDEASRKQADLRTREEQRRLLFFRAPSDQLHSHRRHRTKIMAPRPAAASSTTLKNEMVDEMLEASDYLKDYRPLVRRQARGGGGESQNLVGRYVEIRGCDEHDPDCDVIARGVVVSDDKGVCDVEVQPSEAPLFRQGVAKEQRILEISSGQDSPFRRVEAGGPRKIVSDLPLVSTPRIGEQCFLNVLGDPTAYAWVSLSYCGEENDGEHHFMLRNDHADVDVPLEHTICISIHSISTSERTRVVHTIPRHKLSVIDGLPDHTLVDSPFSRAMWKLEDHVILCTVLSGPLPRQDDELTLVQSEVHSEQGTTLTSRVLGIDGTIFRLEPFSVSFGSASKTTKRYNEITNVKELVVRIPQATQNTRMQIVGAESTPFDPRQQTNPDLRCHPRDDDHQRRTTSALTPIFSDDEINDLALSAIGIVAAPRSMRFPVEEGGTQALSRALHAHMRRILKTAATLRSNLFSLSEADVKVALQYETAKSQRMTLGRLC